MIISLLAQQPLAFVAWILAILFALTIHEFAHAYSAYLLGDNTAKQMGRLTLNPMSHIDPMGFMLLLFVGFGWAKPVPFNPYNLKNQRWGPAIVGLAGPFSNLLSVVVFGIVLKFLVMPLGVLPSNLLFQFLLLLIFLNIVLLLFNLIPIPPLDGSKVLLSVIPDRYHEFKVKLEQRGPIVLLLLIIMDAFLPVSILGSLFQTVLSQIDRFF